MKIIWTNGCFDLLHPGHVEMLNYAKSLGDYLVVGVNSDDMVKNSKGSNRPVMNERQRMYMLENIGCVDEVVLFSSQKMLNNLIKEFEPDTIVVGSDYRNRYVEGSEHVDSVIFFEKIPGLSTTKILEKK